MMKSTTLTQRAAAFGLATALLMGAPALLPGELATGVAQAQSLDETQRRLDRIRTALDDLDQRYIKPELITSQYSIETRFNDGKVAHVLKQYDMSSRLFLDVITRTKPETYPAHREALYLLSEALFEMRNFVGARNFLTELSRLGPGPFAQEGLRLLLEVAYRTNNYQGVDEVYAQLNQQGSLSPAVRYLQGKTLYGQGRFEDAQRAFDLAASDAEFRALARYYSAVSDVQLGRLDAAAAKFTEIVAQPPKDPRDERVLYLAYLGLGRIAFEQDKLDEALDHYNRLPRTDPNFINAVYEATWVLVKKGSFDAAKENIDVLVYDDPSPEMYTRAMLLRADLALRLRDYDVALDSFEDVLERYDPIKSQMDQFAAQHPDLRTFFLTLVRPDLTLDAPSELPPIRTRFQLQPASEWLLQGKAIERARLLTGDVVGTQAEVQSGQSILDEIEAMLSSGARIKAFPGIQEALGRALTQESELIATRKDLNAQSYKALERALSPQEKSQWQQLSAQEAELATIYAQAPTDPTAINKRDDRVKEDFAALRKRLDELGYQIDSQAAELNAINVFLLNQQVILSEEQRAQVEAERQGIKADLVALEAQRQRLRQDIDIVRQQVGGPALGDADRLARARYRELLAAQGQLLEGARQRAAGAESGRIAAQREQLAQLDARVQGYQRKLLQLVDERVVELRQQVAQERQLLSSYEQTLATMSGDGRQIMADVAVASFLDRKAQFEQIVLRADVGKIDVLYQRHTDTSQEINDLFESRTEELRALQEAFEEVR